MPKQVVIEIELPMDIEKFLLPEEIAHRLQQLLHRQAPGQSLPDSEGLEAVRQVSLGELLSPLSTGGQRQRLRITSEADLDPETGKVRLLAISGLEVLTDQERLDDESEESRMVFWTPKSLEDLAAEQGVGPITDLDAVWGSWPEEDEFDSFLATLQTWREEART